MNKLNCIGDFCPIPLLKLKKELISLKHPGEFILVTDHSCVLESIREYLSEQDYEYRIDEVLNGVWEITIISKI